MDISIELGDHRKHVKNSTDTPNHFEGRFGTQKLDKSQKYCISGSRSLYDLQIYPPTIQLQHTVQDKKETVTGRNICSIYKTYFRVEADRLYKSETLLPEKTGGNFLNNLMEYMLPTNLAIQVPFSIWVILSCGIHSFLVYLS